MKRGRKALVSPAQGAGNLLQQTGGLPLFASQYFSGLGGSVFNKFYFNNCDSYFLLQSTVLLLESRLILFSFSDIKNSLLFIVYLV